MGVKGLTDRQAAFPKIGTLRKGSKKVSEKQPGKDLDHFRFDTPDSAAEAAFLHAYGDSPKEITVYLPFKTVEENFQVWKEAWSAGGLSHRCDGETCTVWYDKEGNRHTESKSCPGGCKAVGRLLVIIPELKRLAYVSVQTHSINDILELQSNLMAAMALSGNLQGIRFRLSRRPKEISTPSGEGGKRARRTKHLLFIEPAPEWVALQLAAQEQAALPQLEGYKAIGVDRVVDIETGETYTEDDEDDYEEDLPEPLFAPEQPGHKVSHKGRLSQIDVRVNDKGITVVKAVLAGRTIILSGEIADLWNARMSAGKDFEVTGTLKSSTRIGEYIDVTWVGLPAGHMETAELPI